jgi:hypothetical protein
MPCYAVLCCIPCLATSQSEHVSVGQPFNSMRRNPSMLGFAGEPVCQLGIEHSMLD